MALALLNGEGVALLKGREWPCSTCTGGEGVGWAGAGGREGEGGGRGGCVSESEAAGAEAQGGRQAAVGGMPWRREMWPGE